MRDGQKIGTERGRRLLPNAVSSVGSGCNEAAALII
jgi:hypothetical protein